MSRLVIEATVDYTLVQFLNIFTEYLLWWEILFNLLGKLSAVS